jgi:hypothetical protein
VSARLYAGAASFGILLSTISASADSNQEAKAVARRI